MLNLFFMGCYFKITDLVSQCVAKLTAMLNDETAVDILLKAVLLEHEGLRDTVLDYITL